MDRFLTKALSKNISGPIPTISSSEGDISVDIATVSSSANARSETVESRSQNPWPYLQEFFEFVSSNEEGDRMVFKCINCLPQSKCYKAQKKSLYSCLLYT